MAEQITHDVVKEAQSMGVPPIDVSESTTQSPAGNGEAPSGPIDLISKLSDAPATIRATKDDTAASTPTTAGGDAAPTANASSETGEPGSNALSKDTRQHVVNGDTGEHSVSESQTVAGDGSGGSDTDISRPGSVDQAKRPEGHLRTNSAVKKPTSFKSVSVTKNFLAKSAVTVPAARPGDKITSATQATNSTLQSAKPRLVAKSGGSNVPRSLGKMNGAGSGPDASKVWNKNQPVPPPPPKQFTDEELKQQYGIHLATRLQADDGGKEAKWADIDDDEDDWAPETVEWMDGTKSTVTAVESQPPPPEEAAPAPRQETPTILAKPTTPATTTPKPSVTGGTKTILKPGAHAQASTAKNKGQQDKPTLVAKPSAAAPVKSPWASLPPVDKVSPVQINPPVQQQQPASRFARESHGYDAMPAPPAKEIAPDDFNRSWRDERGTRELFNSHSGRYEPVGDMRRGSLRDGNYRQQPAVLQRPSHDGPAEPSAAFQTSRTSGDMPAWGRRRNSSNVSGGSGRRMSFDRRVPDSLPMPPPPRRESMSINGAEAGGPGTPRHSLPVRQLVGEQHPPPTTSQKPSPSVAHAQPASPFGSVASQDAVTPGGLNPMQNLVEVQQRLLHGSLDLVKQRKLKEQEDEARKEAEKKERLRKKLEALAPAEEVKPKAKEASPARLPQKSPQKEKAVPAVVQSTPKPPVPTSEGEVAQYGMMKVHQPHPVKKLSPADASAPKPNNTKRSPSPKKLQTEARSQVSPSPPPAHVPSPSLARDSAAPKPAPQQSTNPTTQPKAPDSQSGKPAQPPQGPWSSSSLASRSQGWTSNVWGPPQAMNRALGNGTFTQQVEPQPSAGPTPAPIGPTSALKPSTSQTQAPPSQPFAQQAMYTQTVTQTPQTVGPPNPGPIAPPAQKSGWGNFQAHIRRDDRENLVKAQEKFERMGGATFRPEMRETYVDPKGKAQTTIHGKVGAVDTMTPQPITAPDAKPKDDIKTTHEAIPGAQSAGQSAQPQTSTQGARSSRFFPRPPEVALPTSASNKDDLAPPPESEAHPAFSGDTLHPVVKMPRPPARVRLPPAAAEAAAQTETPVSMPSRKPVGIGARPLALTQEWQARFNSLLEKPSAPGIGHTLSPRPTAPALTAPSPKSGALAIAASSKAPLEVRRSPAPATVSLPTSTNRKTFVDDGSREVTSRIGAEYLLEDREFGSVPTVKLSLVAHLAANEAPAPFPTTPRQNPRYRQHTMEVQSSPPFEVRVFKQTEKDTVTFTIPIKLGNMQTVVTKPLSKNRNDKRGPGQQKPKRNFNNGANDSPTNGQHPRQRKPSNYQSQSSNSTGSPRTSTGNAWSSSRSTPNSLPWGRRQTSAAPVH